MKGLIATRTFESAEDVCTLILRGEFDVEAAPGLKRSLWDAIDSGRVRVVLDFQDVTYVDSTCLSTMVLARRRARARGGSVSVVCQTKHVRRIFDITGLSEVFPIFARWSDALTSLGIAADE